MAQKTNKLTNKGNLFGTSLALLSQLVLGQGEVVVSFTAQDWALLGITWAGPVVGHTQCCRGPSIYTLHAGGTMRYWGCTRAGGVQGVCFRPKCPEPPTTAPLAGSWSWHIPVAQKLILTSSPLLCRTILPDFFVGQEPWDPNGDWSTFPEWLKTRNARKIDK